MNSSPNSNVQFSGIWNDACSRYTDITGIDLKDVNAIPRPSSTDDLLMTIDDQQNQHARYRERRSRIHSLLGPALKGVELLSNVASAGLVPAFPASSLVFGAVTVLLKAAQNVTSAYDSIIKLFETLEAFLTRFKIHERHVIDPDLREITVKKLSLLLTIMGISTKMVKDGRGLRFMKTVIAGKQRSDLQTAMDDFAELSKQEDSLVQALTLSATYDLQAKFWASESTGDESQDAETLLRTVRERLHPVLSVETFYDNVLHEVLPGTGDWILLDSSIQDWIHGRKSLLWISGGPGCGKTHLSARITKHLTDLYPQGLQHSITASVAYFFCREADASTRSVSSILRTTSYQIARNDPAYAKYLHTTLKGESNELGGTARMWSTLFVDYFQAGDLDNAAYLVIDGIDEALREGYDGIDYLLEYLRNSFVDKASRLRVLLVGRPEMDDVVYDILEQRVPMIALSTKMELEGDVEKYIAHRLGRSMIMRKLTKDFRAEVLRKLSGKTFLWVKLVLKEIVLKTRESKIREALDRFPKDLGLTIQHLLRHFSENDADDISDLNTLLAWVTCARRPLTLAELGVVMTISSETMEPILDLEKLLRKRYSTFFTLIREDGLGTADIEEWNNEVCSSLPSIRHNDTDDADEIDEGETPVFDSPESTVVTISHLAFTEYFRSQTSSVTGVGVYVPSAELRLAISCLSLVCIDETNNQKQLDHTSILVYACQHFLDHLVDANRGNASVADKHIVLFYLHKAFTDDTIISLWWGHFRGFAHTLIESSHTVEIIFDWMADEAALTSEVASWCESMHGDARALLYPIVMVAARTWLQRLERRWKPFECFVTVYSFIRRFGLYPVGERFTGGPGSSLSPRNQPPVAVGDALIAARWAGFPEDSTWHARVGRLLRDANNLEGARDLYIRSVALNDSNPAAVGGLGRTYALMQNFKQAIEWCSRAVELGQGEPLWQDDMIECRSLIAIWKVALFDRVIVSTDEWDSWGFASAADSTSIDFLLLYVERLMSYWKWPSFFALLKRIHNAEWRRTLQSLLVTHIRARHVCTFGLELDHFHTTIQMAARDAGEIPFLLAVHHLAVYDSLITTIPTNSPGQTSALQFWLARTYIMDTDELEAGVSLLELILKDNTIMSISNRYCLSRILSMCFLSSIYYERAVHADECSGDPTPFVTHLERLAELSSQSTTPICQADSAYVDWRLDSIDLEGQQNSHIINMAKEPMLILGLWHRKHGRISEARPYFREMLEFVFISLTNYDEDLEINVFERLGYALLMAGDERGARAAYQLIGGFHLEDEAAEDSDSETEDPEVSSSNAYKGHSIDRSCSFVCSGPCDRYYRYSWGVHICCAGCIRTRFCGPCLRKLKRGDIKYRVCSPNHQWLYVSRKGLPELESGMVRFVSAEERGEKKMFLEDWFVELRRTWEI